MVRSCLLTGLLVFMVVVTVVYSEVYVMLLLPGRTGTKDWDVQGVSEFDGQWILLGNTTLKYKYEVVFNASHMVEPYFMLELYVGTVRVCYNGTIEVNGVYVNDVEIRAVVLCDKGEFYLYFNNETVFEYDSEVDYFGGYVVVFIKPAQEYPLVFSERDGLIADYVGYYLDRLEVHVEGFISVVDEFFINTTVYELGKSVEYVKLSPSIVVTGVTTNQYLVLDPNIIQVRLCGSDMLLSSLVVPQVVPQQVRKSWLDLAMVLLPVVTVFLAIVVIAMSKRTPVKHPQETW